MFPKIHCVGTKWKSGKEFLIDPLSNTRILFVHGSGFDVTCDTVHIHGVFLPPMNILEETLEWKTMK